MSDDLDDRDRLQRAYNALCSAAASLNEVETVYVEPFQATLSKLVMDLAPWAYPEADHG